MAQDLDTRAGEMTGAAKCLQGASRQLLEDAYRLWCEWFDDFGDPWFEQLGEWFCIFCDGEDGTHNRYCIYVRAKKLVGEDGD